MSTEVVRGIVELDVEYKGLQEGMAKVNAEFGKTETIAKDTSSKLQNLAENEKQLLEARAKANNPSLIVKLNEELKKTRLEMSKLSEVEKSVNAETNKLSQSTSKFSQTLGKAFNVTQINAAKKSTAELADEMEKMFGGVLPKLPTDEVPENTEKAITSLKELKQAYKEAINEAIRLGERTPGGQEQLKKAAALKDRIGDLQNETKNLSQDFQLLNGAVGFASTLAGGFSVAQGAAALLGDENEDLQKAMLKVQASLAILNGLQEVSLLLQKDSAAAIFVNTVATKAYAIGTEVAAGATRIFNAVLNANPIIFIVTAIIGLVTWLGSLFDWVESVTDAFRTLGEWLQPIMKFLNPFSALTDEMEKQAAMAKKLDEENKKRIATIAQTVKNIYDQINAEKDLQRQQQEAADFQKELLEAQGKDSKKFQLEQLKQQEQFLRKQIELQASAAQEQSKLFGKGKGVDITGAVSKQLAVLDKAIDKGKVGTLEFIQQRDKALKVVDESLRGIGKTAGVGKTITDITVDYNKLQETIKEQLLLTEEISAEAKGRGKELASKVRDVLSDLRKELQEAKDENKGIGIENLLFDETKINEKIDLAKEVYNRQLDERKAALKKEGVLTQEADKLLEQIRLEHNNKFEAQRLNELAKFDQERRQQVIESQNELSELEIELSELGLAVEKQNFDARIALAQDYYDKRIAIAKELGESEDEIRKLELERNIEVKKLQKQQLDDLISTNASKFDEKVRHELAMMQLAKASEADQLQIQIEAETQKLANLILSGKAKTLEAEQLKNKIEELEEKKKDVELNASKEKTLRILDDIQQIVNATLQATNQIISAKIQETDKLIQLQEQRVQEATDIADKGNAELFELEKKRLDDLNKEKEKHVRTQQALAVVELIANSAIAISKAAAEGGAAAPITIAATLIALIAGLAAARQTAQSAAFFKGGYTGDGNPHDESRALGKKPYIYHKGEWVFDHKKTNEFFDIFKRVHEGDIDLNEWEQKVILFDAGVFSKMELMRDVALPVHSNSNEIAELKGVMYEILGAIKSQPYSSVNIDQKGFSSHLKGFINLQNKIDKMAH